MTAKGQNSVETKNALHQQFAKLAPWLGSTFPSEGTIDARKAWSLLGDAICGDPDCVLGTLSSYLIIEIGGIDPERGGWEIKNASQHFRRPTLERIALIMGEWNPDMRTVTPRQENAWSPPEEQIENVVVNIVLGRTLPVASATLAAAGLASTHRDIQAITRPHKRRVAAFLGSLKKRRPG